MRAEISNNVTAGRGYHIVVFLVFDKLHNLNTVTRGRVTWFQNIWPEHEMALRILIS
jgi:hypothetical protein